MYILLYTMYSCLYYSSMATNHEVTNRVRQHRRLREMTQQGLADRVGVTRQTVLSIERGKYNPSVVLALRIARIFGVPVEELFELPKESGNV